MRKESSNQFTEGLVCDLNPVSTPNTVLTDALNATLITYDGNEFSLQNDRGNYPLENCRLKPNYIPVGLKEYGDILYIVSYNPLDESVEIGSYPSPMEVEASKYDDTGLVLNSVIDEIDKEMNHSDLVQKCKTKIWTSDNEEDSKIYPGDIYNINVQNGSPYKYEELEYLLIDEYRDEHNISHHIIRDGEDHYVSWQIPGWLASRYRIGTFDDFIMSIRSVKTPITSDDNIACTMNLNFQFRLSDSLFLPINADEETIKSDLKIQLDVKNNSRTIFSKTISLLESKYIDWYSDTKILWIDDVINFNFDPKWNVEIVATPIVIDQNSKKIIYDKHKEDLSFSYNDIGSLSDFKLGTNVWKFYIDKDEKDPPLYIEYDVDGPIVTNEDVQLYYRACDLNSKPVCEWTPIDNFVGVTEQGFGILPFKEGFQPEGIYILEFVFDIPGLSNDNLREKNPKTTKRAVIASKLFYDFIGNYNNFNRIRFQDWFSKYNYGEIKCNVETEITQQPDSEYQNYTWSAAGQFVHKRAGYVFSDESLRKLWSINKVSNKGLITSLDNVKSSNIEFILGNKIDVKTKINLESNLLQGKLWKNAPSLKATIVPYASDVASTSLIIPRENVNNSDEIELSGTAIQGKSKKFDTEVISNETIIEGIRSIENVPLIWVHTERDNTYANDKSFTIVKGGGYINNTSNSPFISVKPASFIRGEVSVNRNSITLPNEVSDAILRSLGNNDFGVLGLSFDLRDYNTNRRYRLKHGSETVIERSDGEDIWLFTYLVFRKTRFGNACVLVPFDNTGTEVWKRKIELSSSKKIETWWDSTLVNTDFRERVLSQIEPLLKNLYICDSENAVKKAYLCNINTENAWKQIPLGTIEIKSCESSNWSYDGYNLLDEDDRNKLTRLLGSDVCGTLFIGDTFDVSEQLLLSKDINDSESIDLFERTNKIDRQFEKINNLTNETPINSQLKYDIESRINTKGVYYIGSPNDFKDLIKTLNEEYAYSTSDLLTLNKASSSQIYTDVGNDHDKLHLGWVTNNIIAK